MFFRIFIISYSMSTKKIFTLSRRANGIRMQASWVNVIRPRERSAQTNKREYSYVVDGKPFLSV